MVLVGKLRQPIAHVGQALLIERNTSSELPKTRLLMVDTARMLLQMQRKRSWVDGLPSTVAVREIRSRHPSLRPGMEVPHGILIVSIRSTLHLLTKHIKVLVNRQCMIGITGRNEVGHRTRRDTKSAEHCIRQSRAVRKSNNPWILKELLLT